MQRPWVLLLPVLVGCTPPKPAPWTPPSSPKGAVARVPANHLAYQAFAEEDRPDRHRITWSFESREPMQVQAVDEQDKATLIQIRTASNSEPSVGSHRLKVTLELSKTKPESPTISVDVESVSAPLGQDGPTSTTTSRTTRTLPNSFRLEKREITNRLPSGKLWERPIRIDLAEIRPKTGKPYRLVLDAKR